MRFEIFIEREAIEEITEAEKWYEEKSLQALKNFIKEIEEAFKYLRLLLLNIESYSII